MKKFLSALFAVILCILCASCGGEPENTSSSSSKVEKVYYEDGNVLKNCKGQSDANGVFVVPEHITVIGEGAFSGDTEIKKVVLHDGIEKIEAGAFFSAISLEEVVFGKGLKSIGGGAFQYCEALLEVNIPEGVEYIGAKAFYQCSALKKVTLPQSLTSIDSYAFALCAKLPEIAIPDNVSYIGNCAFQSCWSLYEVTLPKSLEKLNYQTFAGCKLLEKVNFAEGGDLKTIGMYAFWQCGELRNISLPDGLEKLERYAFYSCSKLGNVSVPSTLKSCGEYVFDGTPWYKELSDDYAVVGDGILLKCNAPASGLNLSGKGIKTIGGAVFRNTGAYDGTDSYGAATDYGYAQADVVEKIVIPEGVVRIEAYAFDSCWLTKLDIPSSLEYIGDHAFENAILWSSDELNGNVIFTDVDLDKCKELEYIGDYAFANCYGLAEIKLPSDNVEIGAYAYTKTQATFEFLKNAYLNNRDENSFYIVGSTLICTYVAKPQESVVIPDGITRIAGTALIGWDSSLVITEDPYEEVSDPEDLYDRNSYYLGYNIKSVTIPEGVKYIDTQAFFGMRALETVALPDSLLSLGEAAFMNCYTLKSVSVGKSLEEIEDKVFQYCHELVEIAFPETLEKAGSDIFDGCTSLEKVIFPVGAEDMGSDIFSTDCVKLKEIYISPDLAPRIYGIIGDLYTSVSRSTMQIHYYIKK